MTARQTIQTLIDAKSAIIFDLFHTLTSVEIAMPGRPSTSEILGVDRKEWNRQLLEHSRERLIGKDKDPVEIIRKMAHAIDPGIPMNAIELAACSRMEMFEGALVNVPEFSIQTLRWLKERKKKIGLLSNADVMEIRGWDRSPAAHFFDSVIFSCSVGCAKPEREIYEISMRDLGEVPERCVFIGDGGSDELRGARDAGIATIMVAGVIRDLWPDTLDEKMKYADIVIERVDELIMVDK